MDRAGFRPACLLDSPASLCYTNPSCGGFLALVAGRIAQLVEQLTLNQRVPGSSPGAPTNQIKHLASGLVEQTAHVLQCVLHFCSRFELDHRNLGKLHIAAVRTSRACSLSRTVKTLICQPVEMTRLCVPRAS